MCMPLVLWGDTAGQHGPWVAAHTIPAVLPQAAWSWLSGRTDFRNHQARPLSGSVRPVRQEARGFLFIHAEKICT